jgi:hypothetical protein
VLGVIDQPIARERWVGVGRTTLNGQPVKTRPCRELAEATIATTGPHYFSQHEGDHFMALASQTDYRRMVMGGDATTMPCWPASSISSAKPGSSCTTGPPWCRWSKARAAMADWNGDPLHIGSEGHVLALGDPARLDDAIEALAAGTATGTDRALPRWRRHDRCCFHDRDHRGGRRHRPGHRPSFCRAGLARGRSRSRWRRAQGTGRDAAARPGADTAL